MTTWIVKHPGIYPVGACTVVTARFKLKAIALVLTEALRAGIDLGPLAKISGWDWLEVQTDKAGAINILNGDY